MASMTVIGLDELIPDFAALAELPDSVIDDMLLAKADVIEKAQQNAARTMLGGAYYTGTTAGSIKRGKSKKTADGRVIEIKPEGSRSDNVRKGYKKSTRRNAEVAFINEFGKKGQPARPFIDKANNAAGDEATAKAEKIYHAFVDSKNL